jgi:hypothetical protein
MFKCIYPLITAAALIAAPAHASVTIAIDKSTQQMTVSVNGQPTYQWPVSTARAGYTTPNGVYRPQSMQRSHFSSMYHNSPMPHSIFFHAAMRSMAATRRAASAGPPRMAVSASTPPMPRRSTISSAATARAEPQS